MAQLLINPKNQFLDDNGEPLDGGKLYFYEAGTTTPTDTYTDQGGATPNTNPVVLDSAGRAEVWMDPAQAYKVRLTDSDNVQIWEVDDVEYLPDGFVGTAKLADGAVTAVKLGSSSVTTAKLNNLAVTTAKIANSAVTEVKLANGSVTADKLASGAVNYDKLGTINTETSPTSGTYSNGTASETDVLTDTITTNGRPVLIKFQSDGNGTYPNVGSNLSAGDSGGSVCTARFTLYRGATEIGRYIIRVTATGSTAVFSEIPPGALDHIDTPPAAGTYTYKLAASVTLGTGSVEVSNVVMKLVEL